MAAFSRSLLAGLLVLSAPVLAAPASPDTPTQPVILANHRAVYDLALSGTSGTRTVDAARGRIVIDFRGDACRGYTMQTRQVTELTSGETGTRLSDLRSTTFEGGEGRDFRFKSTTVSDNDAGVQVDGTATEEGNALSVKLKKGKPFTAEGPVLFPSAHMKRLVESARAGETTLSVKVYDGSDDGRKVYDTLAVIGRPATGTAANEGAELEKPLQAGPIASVRRWPVKLTYYTAGVGERTPIYTLSFDLYENGVSGRIKLDYGDFALVGTMSSLDLEADGQAAKNGGKGCVP